MVEFVNDLVEIWESSVESSDQGNLEGVVRFLHSECQRPVGEALDLREVPDNGTPIIPRSFKVTPKGVGGHHKIIIKHVCETKTVSHSFNDGWRLPCKVGVSRVGIYVVMNICRF